MPAELEEIIGGLLLSEKMISPKYFYDGRGSQLFDQITRLPEYYPAGTELGIMQDNIDEIVALIGEHASLIEFGSGSSSKTRILLENLNQLAAYVPVDISADHLLESSDRIQQEFPGIEVLPVVADFSQAFALPNPKFMPLRNIVYFPGSTLGNFAHDAAHDLLGVMYQEAGENGALLIGIDLQKDAAIINRAYNDSAGVTAEFNLNMLQHLNQAFGFDFELSNYSHNAHYDEAEGRIEMHLVSSCDQIVTAGDAEILIGDGEAILTEYSHKYTLDGFAEMALSVGFDVKRVWTDADALFSVQYCCRG